MHLDEPLGESHETTTPDDEYQTSQPLPAVSVGDAYDRVARLAPSTVDCVVTSPPYWGLRSYGHEHDEQVLDKWASAHPNIPKAGLANHAPGYDWYRANGGVLGLEPYPQWFVGHLVEIFERLKPAIKKTGSVWVNLGDTYFARWSSIRSDGRQGLGAGGRTRRRTPSGGAFVDKQLLLIPSRFAIAMQDAGWILRNDVIWAKTSVPPRAEGDRLRLSHEHLFHFVLRPSTGRAKYYYDLSAAEPGANDVIRVNPHRGTGGHSATFPVDLVRPRIETSSPPAGLVLDPFCGTGSALEAAILAGRRAHGIELSESYATTARRRVRLAKERRLAGDLR
ncbi:site-specific DNA-methyltransferase [Rathayibacter sp. AY1C9]|uniref:DNA-methyltransferase n=1 Tax=Rathayibacter sp. AY1C9 TaxID=2080541 RepID=UPI000CE88F32|nr:site-specific DNA-methyltransferase [Rathayibacter sp. AY1C9]